MRTASLRLEDSFRIAASSDAVWTLLTDPQVVVACVPGAVVTGERPDGTLLGSLSVKLGPTTVEFSGEVVPSLEDAARRGSLRARGSDEQGRTKALAVLDFRLDGSDGEVVVSTTGEIEVTGGLAPFVRTGGARLAQRMVADFGENLAARASAPGARGRDPGGPIGAPGTAAAPVSGTRLARRAFGDWLRSLARRAGRALRRGATATQRGLRR